MTDLKFALRQLLKHPGFTAVAVLTLALGIGANTALFTAVNTVLLRPLPVHDPAQLAYVSKQRGEDFSFPFFQRFRAAMTSFSAVEAVQYRVSRWGLADAGTGGAGETVDTQGATGGYFATLGVPALLGRTFGPDDDKSGAANPVVVISHGLWQRRFGADPNIVGRALQLDMLPVTVIGVMPPGFFGFQADVNPEVWWPLQLGTQFGRRDLRLMNEGVSWLVLFGRLREGMTLDQAEAEAKTFHRVELEAQVARNPNRPAAERERLLAQTIELRPGAAGFVGARSEFRQPLTVLMIAVGVVLLIASANLAGLLLARGAARQREFAVRAALGAGRGRVLRLLLTESVLLALSGGALGTVFALWGTGLLTQFLAQTNVPVVISPDTRVLLFTIGVSLFTGILFGFAPAWRLSRLDLVSTIKGHSQGSTAGAGSRLQPSLVVVQVALAVLLLAGAGLFARTLRKLQTVELGFARENLLHVAVDPGRWRPTAAEQTTLLRKVLAEVTTLPGVRSASVAGAGLLTGNGLTMDAAPEGYVAAPDEEVAARVVLAGPEFFATLGVTILQGRAFLPTDEPPPSADGILPPPRAAIIGEQVARKYFPGADAVGRTLMLDARKRVEIVGVARDTRYSQDLRAAVPLQIYLPFFGSDLRMPPTIYVRTEQSAAALAADLRRALARVDSRLSPRDLRAMDETIDRLLVRERVITQLTGFFSAFSLLLACLGIYGLLAFRVTQRTREIGVRVALGATLRDVVALVLRQGLALVVLGGVLGIGAAFLVTRYLATLLYGVTPADPATFMTVMALLGVVALLACWLPARRAARVDPMEALRNE